MWHSSTSLATLYGVVNENSAEVLVTGISSVLLLRKTMESKHPRVRSLVVISENGRIAYSNSAANVKHNGLVVGQTLDGEHVAISPVWSFDCAESISRGDCLVPPHGAELPLGIQEAIVLGFPQLSTASVGMRSSRIASACWWCQGGGRTPGIGPWRKLVLSLVGVVNDARKGTVGCHRSNRLCSACHGERGPPSRHHGTNSFPP